MNYPHIFSPIKIGKTVFKNRIWTAPAAVHLLNGREEYPSDAAIEYYAAKAAGGAAVITYSAQNMDFDQPYDPIHACENILREENHRHWRRLTDTIHFYDAKASLELLAFAYHGRDDAGNPIVYSIDGKPDRSGNPTVMLTREIMEDIASTYADAAEAAVKCGFDMLLIHGGHGLVISQFYSPVLNTRTDEFGCQCAENKMRFAGIILDAIRARVGDKLLIEYRISGDELFPEGEPGYHVEDVIEMLLQIQDRIDIAHISTGVLYNDSENIMHPTVFLPHGCNARYAAAVKADERIHIPVLTLGAFQDPEQIEETLAFGQADIVAMARGLISDAQRVNKWREEREADAIPCVRCFHCLNYRTEPAFSCSVNPTVGRERLLRMIAPLQAGTPKNVLVIGGGPAGMQAAITASQRGHHVTLLERENHLGGNLEFSSQVPFKQDLCRFMNYLIGQVEKSGTDIRLGTEATPELARRMHPDAVIAAVGADFNVPPIPGIDGDNVITAEEAYHRISSGAGLPQKIAVLGGGLVGCETGLYLAEEEGKDVTILEQLPEVAEDEMFLTREALLDRLTRQAAIITDAQCSGISSQGITYIDGDGVTQSILCDLVILSAGMRPRQDLAESFRDIAPFFTVIGDALTPASIRQATRTGYDCALRL